VESIRSVFVYRYSYSIDESVIVTV